MQKSSEPFRHNPTLRQFLFIRYDLRATPSHFEYSRAQTQIEPSTPGVHVRHMQPPCRGLEAKHSPLSFIRDEAKASIP